MKSALDTYRNSMSHEELQDSVIQVAHALGWKAAGFRKAQYKDGSWSTPLLADGLCSTNACCSKSGADAPKVALTGGAEQGGSNCLFQERKPSLLFHGCKHFIKGLCFLSNRLTGVVSCTKKFGNHLENGGLPFHKGGGTC